MPLRELDAPSEIFNPDVVEWLKELHSNAGTIMTAMSVLISAGVAVFSVRTSVVTRRKTHFELQEHESRIVRPTPQEVEKYGRPSSDIPRAVRKKPPLKAVPVDSDTSTDGRWLGEEVSDFDARYSLEQASVLRRARTHRLLRGSELQLVALVRGTIFSVFLGTAGLSYVYLENQIHQSYVETKGLDREYRELLVENHSLEQRERLMISQLRGHAKTGEDKVKLEERLATYKKNDGKSSTTSPSSP